MYKVETCFSALYVIVVVKSITDRKCTFLEHNTQDDYKPEIVDVLNLPVEVTCSNSTQR